ncbi:TonB-dependent receptor [Sphingobium algorifonticola]|uniref:TonB-dependent receptor n=1 Tax=Sphingobium algorifonticola TaxID=2008318 RepID=A0A437J5P7_9SPHN|nr:TonB-dependent receptor [Sphingobium algorifonticola]RVT40270.1 TonB-dependent receptor [Sphingobium algorifonticola]
MAIKLNRLTMTALGGGAAFLALLAPASAFAQASTATQASDAETANGGAIIVTANKREERLVDVASSVSVVSGADLNYRNLQRIEDFAAQVPGFNFQPGGVRQVRLVLRGLNSGGAGATTAVVIDETPLSYQSGLANGAADTANFDTYDMARIEVLKGPQGTLYGATSQGGLLKYVTTAPELDRIALSSEIGSEVIDGGGAGYFGRGMINVPIISDTLAVRATGYYQKVAGYIDNPTLNRNNVNGGERWGGRISALFKPSDAFSLRVTAARQEQEFDDSGFLEVVGSNLTPGNPPANQFDLANNGRFILNTNVGNPSRNVYEYVNATATLDVGFAELLSSTSFGHLSTDFIADLSFGNPAVGAPLTFSTLLGGIYGQPVAVTQVQSNKSDRSNQEIRLTSKPGSRVLGMAVDWLVGGFYANESVIFPQGFDVRSLATGNVLTVPFAGGSLLAPAKYKEYSGFANVNFHLTDTLELALGGRYTENKQSAQTTYFAGFATGPADEVTPTTRSKENKWTYSAAVSWKFNPDSLLYGRVASGYRPGGINRITPGNTLPPDVPTTFDADNTVNYELGVRTALFDKRVNIDIAAFYIDWTDIQILTTFRSTTTGQNVTLTGNAGTARSRGLEWNIGWTPTPGLRLSTVGAYTNAELTESRPLLGGNDGDQLPFVPKWTNTVNADYETALSGNVTGFIGGSWIFSSGGFTGFTADPAPGQPTYPDHIKLPSYHLFNMQAGLRFDEFDLSFYIRNLTDDRTLTSYNPSGGAGFTGTAQILQPRTFGVRAAVRF